MRNLLKDLEASLNFDHLLFKLAEDLDEVQQKICEGNDVRQKHSNNNWVSLFSQDQADATSQCHEDD